MKHLFIINPAAGRGLSIPQLQRQISNFYDENEVSVISTRKAGHATELARAAAATGAPVRIYACGGDGTLNEVVNGAAGFDNAAVTQIPIGTGNDFLRIFGPDYILFQQLPLLKEGPQTAFDLMDCNGRLGLGVTCAGLDARIGASVHNYTRVRLLNSNGAYLLSLAVNVLLKDLARPMKVTVNGETWDQDTTILCVCNGRYYGGGFMPTADAMPDDGMFELFLVPRISRSTFFRLFREYGNGRYAEHPDLIRFYRTRELTFSSPANTTVVVDGEIMKGHDFTLRLSDKKVNFFYPEGASYQPR